MQDSACLCPIRAVTTEHPGFPDEKEENGIEQPEHQVAPIASGNGPGDGGHTKGEDEHEEVQHIAFFEMTHQFAGSGAIPATGAGLPGAGKRGGCIRSFHGLRTALSKPRSGSWQYSSLGFAADMVDFDFDDGGYLSSFRNDGFTFFDILRGVFFQQP